MRIKIIFIFLFICSFNSYANENGLLANGYWLQTDESTNTNVAVIHAYNNSQDNLNARIYVPLSNIDYGKIHPPIIYCKLCNKGNAYGNKYDYSSGKDKYQGLEFVWNLKKQISNNNDNSMLYNDGAVLNPHDGQYYHVQAKTIKNGNKILVKAFWGPLSKKEYWQRISKIEAEKIKKLCGLTNNNVYPYANEDGEVINQDLFDECSTRDFIKNPISIYI